MHWKQPLLSRFLRFFTCASFPGTQLAGTFQFPFGAPMGSRLRARASGLVLLSENVLRFQKLHSKESARIHLCILKYKYTNILYDKKHSRTDIDRSTDHCEWCMKVYIYIWIYMMIMYKYICIYIYIYIYICISKLSCVIHNDEKIICLRSAEAA